MIRFLLCSMFSQTLIQLSIFIIVPNLGWMERTIATLLMQIAISFNIDSSQND